MYFDVFGEEVPVSIDRLASRMGFDAALNQMLADRIDQGTPVQDWNVFAKVLFAPLDEGEEPACQPSEEAERQLREFRARVADIFGGKAE